ncbi:helix-turn-helix domain-containing protein [Candidatus Electrothrix sp.]|uniref:helix-turn-helix domain-containing protein n=1 Tax=Candidatus Electrothrix sp. TaxID=2170559 RepID=UPI00405764D6
MTLAVQPLTAAWGNLHTLIPFFPIRDEQQYEQAAEALNSLLDIVGEDENHPLYDLTDTLGMLLFAYEEQHFATPDASGADILRFLMDEHGLTAADLPEIGDESLLTDILAGTRSLTVDHVKALSRRFHVAAATFV